MVIYYVIFSFLAISAVGESLTVKRSQRLLTLGLIWLTLSLFAGLRYDNPDWENYTIMYDQIATGNGFGSLDIGFNLLCKLLSTISTSPVLMFLTVAVLSTGFNLESFKKYSPYFLICVLYYFVHLYVLKDMIQIRAGLASGICLFSIRFLEQKRYRKFLFVWLIAITMHMSAVVWGLVLALHLLKWSRKTLAFALTLCLLIGLVYPLGQVIKIIAGGIDERLDAYISYGDGGYAAELGVFTNMATIKSLLVAGSLLIFYKRLEQINGYFRTLSYAYMAGVCWLLLFNDFAIIGARMSNILFSVEPVLISYLVFLFSKRSRWIVALLLIAITFLMFTLNIDPDKVVPYQFYFSANLM